MYERRNYCGSKSRRLKELVARQQSETAHKYDCRKDAAVGGEKLLELRGQGVGKSTCGYFAIIWSKAAVADGREGRSGGGGDKWKVFKKQGAVVGS